MDFDAEIIAACVSAIAAVVALGIACWQTCLSNRQSLFARRLALWVNTEKLVCLYRNSARESERDEVPQLAIGLRYTRLTNTTFLQEITPCIAHASEADYRLKLHLKLDDLNSLATEARFIFKEKPGIAIANFLDAYQALLFSMYRYQILLDHMQKNARDFSWTLEEAIDEVNEKSQRKELLDAENALNAAYGSLTSTKMISEIERQIRLTRYRGTPSTLS